MGSNTKPIRTKTTCYHCGDDVVTRAYQLDDRDFCCLGCQTVYQVLSSANMQQYYRLNTHPGKSQVGRAADFAYLDEPSIADKLIDFKNDQITIITSYVPAIHCSACVWLLEHLYKLEPAIVKSQTDFMKKQLSITFKHGEKSLRKVVELLAAIGYEPKITLQDVVKAGKNVESRGLVARIAVAGFCFGNSMMLSFPEYLGMAAFEAKYAHYFGYLNLAFAIPVLLYSGMGYFRSAWYSLKQKQLNLDVPLALGIAVLFLRTAWEVLSGAGPGFADTLCGLVFFLLIGKWVQQRTYYHLSFERDYRSYFPVAVTRITEAGDKPVPIGDLEVGDRILIRNNEVVPADAILLKGHAAMDFSFVTGESAPVTKVLGEVVYAGGRQTAEAIELEIVKPVSQSYLTKLWNNENAKPHDKRFRTFSNTVSRYFTVVLLAIATLAALYWSVQGESGRAWGAFTAALIIACPCALALSSPFTLSAALSIFDRNRLYVKNAATVEQMAAINSLVFDKTGTLSSPSAFDIEFEGQLSNGELSWVASVCRNSAHPLSREVVKWADATDTFPVTRYEEIAGEGIAATVQGNYIRVGNAGFVDWTSTGAELRGNGSRVFVSINNEPKGYFYLEQPWREGLASVVSELARHYSLQLISGDNDKSKETLLALFPASSELRFGCMPADKEVYVQLLQEKGQQVCMIGDGLNDAGALRQANLGIAVSDDINNFSPGCDAILDGRSFGQLPQFFSFAKDTLKVIHMSFVISLMYNVVGLGFAVQGTMSPLFAAILMPLSTVTIIGFTSTMTHAYARRRGMKQGK